MSLFAQYQLAQSFGDLGQGDASPAVSAAGQGFGFGLGVMLPQLLWRYARPTWPAPPLAVGGPCPWPPWPLLPPPAVAHFCGHCGEALVPAACFCGHCGAPAFPLQR